jgi:osmotically-inducible protein OsmY
MNHKHRVKVRYVLVVMMSMFVPIGAARADTRSDAVITLKAQSALHAAAGLRMTAVHVDALDGRVTLYGKVRTQKDKAFATANVEGLAGVVDVRNILQVVGPSDKERVKQSDDAVKADVQRTLSADRSLDDSRITVASVSNGVVLLDGTAASANDIVRAFASTGDRPGVRRVYSEIDAQRAIVAPSEARHAGIPVEAASTIGRKTVDAEDDTIRVSVMRALTDLDALGNAGIRVMVKDGVVWLNGSVPTWEGNSSRLHAVRSVTGVRSINNSVRVVALQ